MRYIAYSLIVSIAIVFFNLKKKNQSGTKAIPEVAFIQKVIILNLHVPKD